MATHIKLEGGGHAFGAWEAGPEGAPKGGIVVIQEICGVNAHIRRVVDGFAQDGYRTIAPAFFDLVRPDVELDYDAEGMKEGVELAGKIPFDTAIELVRAAAAHIQPAGRVGVVGYCWGGTVAYLSAIRLGLPAVSYYGGRNARFVEEKTRAPVMFHYGERDKSISADDRERVRKANPEAEFFVYPAGHAFNRDVGGSYDEASAALARRRTLDFLARHLA